MGDVCKLFTNFCYVSTWKQTLKSEKRVSNTTTGFTNVLGVLGVGIMDSLNLT